jgi:hypothetical protein
MQFFLFVFGVALVHSKPTVGKRNLESHSEEPLSKHIKRVARRQDSDGLKTIELLINNSSHFSHQTEVIFPLIEEWLLEKPFSTTFSSITNSSRVFSKLAEYVIESEKGINPPASFVYSPYENVTTVEFDDSDLNEVKLTLLFRASKHYFLASEFHRYCDDEGPTITLVKAWNGKMGAFYNSAYWSSSDSPIPNLRGFAASIDERYSLKKYSANDAGVVTSVSGWGPQMSGLSIVDRCNMNDGSGSLLLRDSVYDLEGANNNHVPLFETRLFGVSQYEVFRVEF